MFARFGPEARQVIELAEDHARALWRTAVGPEHLLLALLGVDERGLLAGVGLRFDDVRARLRETSTPEPRASAAREVRHLPLRLRSVFRDAFRQAALLGSPEVTPLHLALALVEYLPGEVALVLRGAGVDAEAVRDVLRAETVDAGVAAEVGADDGAPDNVVHLPAGDDRDAADEADEADEAGAVSAAT